VKTQTTVKQSTATSAHDEILEDEIKAQIATLTRELQASEHSL
jgi:hypothetical protein